MAHARRHRLPALIFALLGPICANEAVRRRARLGLVVAALAALAIWIGPSLHLDNWRFLWNPAFSDTLKDRPSGAGLQFPNVWEAFGNSLILAVSVMVIVVLVSTLAGYYLSRFAFAGRAGLLKSLIVLLRRPARPAKANARDSSRRGSTPGRR